MNAQWNHMLILGLNFASKITAIGVNTYIYRRIFNHPVEDAKTFPKDTSTNFVKVEHFYVFLTYVLRAYFLA